MTQLVEVDSRRRISLGPAVREAGTHYMVEVDDDGVITLTPAVVMSEAEVRLLQRPDILAEVERSRREPDNDARPVRRR
jgi:hypothetical protein